MKLLVDGVIYFFVVSLGTGLPSSHLVNVTLVLSRAAAATRFFGFNDLRRMWAAMFEYSM